MVAVEVEIRGHMVAVEVEVRGHMVAVEVDVIGLVIFTWLKICNKKAGKR